MPVESDCITQPSKHPFFLSGPARRGSCFRGYKVLENGNNFQTLKSRHVPPQSCVALPWSAVFSGPDQHARLWNGANNNSQKSGIVLPSGPKEQPSKKCSRAILNLNLDWMYKILTWSMSSQLSTRWGCSFLKLYDSILHYALLDSCTVSKQACWLILCRRLLLASRPMFTAASIDRSPLGKEFEQRETHLPTLGSVMHTKRKQNLPLLWPWTTKYYYTDC